MDFRERLGDQDEFLRSAMDARQAMTWTALPGIVVSVNLGAATAVVQPAIKVPIYQNDGSRTYAQLPSIPDVPLVFPRGGGYMLTFPVSTGDEVLLVFASRRIDFWWQSGGVQPSHDVRMNDLSDAFAIPGPFSQPSVASIPSAGASLRSTDGSYLVDLGVEPGKLKIKAPTEVHIQAPTIFLDGTVVP